MKNKLKKLCKNESGATAIEYALIASLVFIVIIASVNSLGTTLGNNYSAIGSSVTSAVR